MSTSMKVAFFVGLALIIAWFVKPADDLAQNEAPPLSELTEDLGNGLFAHRDGNRRSFFLISDEGVIVIDPLNAEAAQAMRGEIAKLTDQPVKYVVYTNSFFDRSSGGQIFKDDGAEFIAQEDCAVELNETPNPNVVSPDTTFGASIDISLGDKMLELRHFGPSYGVCFTVVVAKPANVMILSDIIMPGGASLPRDPTIAHYNLYALMDFFNAVETYAEESNIPTVAAGYAPLGETYAPISPISLVSEQKRFWETLLDEVEVQYKRRLPARVIPLQMDMTRFEEFAGYQKRYIQIMARRVYSLYRIGRR